MMTSIQNKKEIPGWHKPETRVTCPLDQNRGISIQFHEGGKVGRSDVTPIKIFSIYENIFRKILMGVASLLPIFSPSRNGNSGPTLHFITYTQFLPT